MLSLPFSLFLFFPLSTTGLSQDLAWRWCWQAAATGQTSVQRGGGTADPGEATRHGRQARQRGALCSELPPRPGFKAQPGPAEADRLRATHGRPRSGSRRVSQAQVLCRSWRALHHVPRSPGQQAGVGQGQSQALQVQHPQARRGESLSGPLACS